VKNGVFNQDAKIVFKNLENGKMIKKAAFFIKKDQKIGKID
jgi:hypothetical protein